MNDYPARMRALRRRIDAMDAASAYRLCSVCGFEPVVKPATVCAACRTDDPGRDWDAWAFPTWVP